jgi:NAD(P)H-hydrate epimerase
MSALPKLPRRDRDAHKWDVGSVLVVGGAPGMTGAAFLAAKAALKSGAGVVVTACPKSIQPILATKHTCVMVRGVACTETGGLSCDAVEPILDLAERFDAVVIGPGLGRERPTLEAVRRLVGSLTKPVVLDADGLFAFSSGLPLLAKAKAPLVLTPHLGELAHLLGTKGPNRDAMLDEALAQAPAITLVVKGPNTLVGKKGAVSKNDTGNPGMATAGSGDVLSGVIGALLGAGLPAWDAARLGVWLHGRAGDLAATKLGVPLMIATDILENVPFAIAERMKQESGT